MNPAEVYVIVAAYNEAPVIASALAEVIERGYQVVVVDDGSTDATWDALQTMAVHRLRHPINLGQGAALQTGVRFALGRGARYVVHFDADGQHPAAAIDALLEPLVTGRAEVSLGSRFLRPQDRQQIPKSKRLALRLAVWVNYLFTGLLLSDAHNGLRALTRRAASQIDLRANRYAHATELLRTVNRLRLAPVEVPTTIRYTDYSRQKGQSLWNAVNIVVDLLLKRVFD